MTRIAIFSNQADAQAYSDKIHAYLQANRPNYNAVKWCDPEQSADGKEFFVKQPVEEEVQKWPVAINTAIEKAKAAGITLPMPEEGQPVDEGKYYLYKGSVYKCKLSHNRMHFDPKDTINLFSSFRNNEDQLKWIPNEDVEPPIVRLDNGVMYECNKAHTTREGWEPSKTVGDLWLLWQDPNTAVKPPQWVSGNWGQYGMGYQVYDSGKIWEVIGLSHTWIQPAATGNGAISWKFIKNWVD